MSVSATTEPMRLAIAWRRAEQIVNWLEPFCERIEIAGSIRRERPLCNDVDLVVIPKIEKRELRTDLLSSAAVSVNILRERLILYVQENPGACWKGRLGEAGPEPREDASNLLLVTRAGVQVDVWCASPENFVTRLICRTGSKEHNIWAAERAKTLKGKWQPYEGLSFGGADPSPMAREQDFYKLLGVEFVRPQDRERDFLNRIWRVQ